MSLFIGNLSKNVSYDTLKELFQEVGKCKIERKVSIFHFIRRLPLSSLFLIGAPFLVLVTMSITSTLIVSAPFCHCSWPISLISNITMLISATAKNWSGLAPSRDTKRKAIRTWNTNSNIIWPLLTPWFIEFCCISPLKPTNTTYRLVLLSSSTRVKKMPTPQRRSTRRKTLEAWTST